MTHRNFEQDCLRGTKQAVNVFFQFEDAAVVGADAFKNSVAVKQSVVEHGDFCVALVEIFAINENFHAKSAANVFQKTGRGKCEVEFCVTAVERWLYWRAL